MQKATFTYVPAEDDQTDPQWVLDQNPCWNVQDGTEYGAGYGINETSPEGTAPEDFWLKDHGFKDEVAEAKAECARLAGYEV